MNTIQKPTSRTVDAAPLFPIRLINGMVRGDPRQSAISRCILVVLVLDVLTGKTPLYRLWERLTTTDVAFYGKRPERVEALGYVLLCGPVSCTALWSGARRASGHPVSVSPGVLTSHRPQNHSPSRKPTGHPRFGGQQERGQVSPGPVRDNVLRIMPYAYRPAR